MKRFSVSSSCRNFWSGSPRVQQRQRLVLQMSEMQFGTHLQTSAWKRWSRQGRDQDLILAAAEKKEQALLGIAAQRLLFIKDGEKAENVNP